MPNVTPLTSPQLQTLIPFEGSVFEIVQRRICDILSIEREGQKALGAPIDADFRVFFEGSNPLAEWNADDLKDVDRRPIVNVSLESSTEDPKRSSATNTHTSDVLFNIDCFGLGFGKLGQIDATPADVNAALAGFRAAFLVRRILLSSNYTHLKLKGIVGARSVQSMQAHYPQSEDRSVQRVRAVRVVLAVRLTEENQEYIGEPIEHLKITSLKENGEIFYEMEFNYTTTPE